MLVVLLNKLLLIDDSPCQHCVKQDRKRIRNKWSLFVTLFNNPSLLTYRKEMYKMNGNINNKK